jgi:hypothetical protein
LRSSEDDAERELCGYVFMFSRWNCSLDSHAAALLDGSRREGLRLFQIQANAEDDLVRHVPRFAIAHSALLVLRRQDPRFLPEGWEQRISKDGQLFFAFAPARATTWNDP